MGWLILISIGLGLFGTIWLAMSSAKGAKSDKADSSVERSSIWKKPNINFGTIPVSGIAAGGAILLLFVFWGPISSGVAHWLTASAFGEDVTTIVGWTESGIEQWLWVLPLILAGIAVAYKFGGGFISAAISGLVAVGFLTLIASSAMTQLSYGHSRLGCGELTEKFGQPGGERVNQHWTAPLTVCQGDERQYVRVTPGSQLEVGFSDRAQAEYARMLERRTPYDFVSVLPTNGSGSYYVFVNDNAFRAAGLDQLEIVLQAQ